MDNMTNIKPTDTEIEFNVEGQPIIIPPSNLEPSKMNNKYDYLVFSGGGIKGVSYCGVAQSLEKNLASIKKIKGFAGTSAGSLVAALLAVGFNATELTRCMMELDTYKILDANIIRDAMNLYTSWGLAPGKFIYDYMGELIKQKTGDADYTIEQLYLDKQIELVIVGMDMNLSMCRYFHPKSKVEADRKIPIRKAIRISMSVPYIFEPVKHLDHYHVDGGVLDNYPIHVFDGAYPGDPKSKNGQCQPNSKVLGFRIISKSDESILNDTDPNPREITSLLDYSALFIKAFTLENDRKTMTDIHKSRTINIVTPDIDIINFSLTKTEKNNLIDIGAKATMEFFRTSKS